MSITIPTLAQQLGVKPDSLRRQLRRLDIQTHGQLDDEQYRQIIGEYSKPSGRRDPDTVAAAQAIAGQMGLSVNAKLNNKTTASKGKTTTMAKRRRPAEVQKRSGIDRALMSRTFLLSVLLLSLVWQMIHTAGLIGRMDAGEPIWSNYCYAAGVQFTALVLTLHNGGRGYLIGFAAFEFAVNLLYYEPWMVGGHIAWARAILISAGVAFAIYSYSAILTRTTK
ncbi:MAG: hypothetical protein AAGG75_25505 [Bacteroidota bacterium]